MYLVIIPCSANMSFEAPGVALGRKFSLRVAWLARARAARRKVVLGTFEALSGTT
jgi:hypothetical protein